MPRPNIEKEFEFLLEDASLKRIIYETSNDVKWIKEKLGKICTAQGETEERVDRLESWRDKVHAFFFLTGAGISGTWAKLMKLF